MKKTPVKHAYLPNSAQSHGSTDRTRILLCTFLFVLAILPYFGIWNFDFVSLDDPQYITQNPQVQAGLTTDSIAWAWTTTTASNWHPISWLSHMLDVEIYGLNAGGHHVSSVLLHGFNTLLLFGFLARATGNVGRSAFVAALFAVHPLHVESVAWVSERKDVLSTFFMLLCLWSYLAWVKTPTWVAYAAVGLSLAMGLMAKPMLVTLPFVLLLLDAWPLNRLTLVHFDRAVFIGLLKEKLPLFALALASIIITVLVQGKGGAIASTQTVSLDIRLANAVVSYVNYILHMFAPVDLAALYPFPITIPVWKWLGSVMLLLSVTAIALKYRITRPWLMVGWLFFLGTLVPVIGLVQVGSQAMADRYTYVPLIGLFIIISWGGYDLLGKSANKTTPLLATALLILATLTALAYAQSRFWQNSATLWKHTLANTSNNYRAQSAYGSILVTQGKVAEAIPYFRNAIRIQPQFARAHNKLGAALAELGQHADAIPYYRNAIAIQSGQAEALNNLGNALAKTGELDEALTYYKSAIAADANYASPHNGLGSALDDLGKLDEAIAEYEKAILLQANFAAAHSNLAVAWFRKGNLEQAVSSAQKAIQLQPANPSYQYNLAIIQIKNNQPELARQNLNLALKIDPGYQPALTALNSLPEP